MQLKSSFRVRGLGGEKRLTGKIAISGAKNSVLKAIAASIVFEDTLEVTNVPDIEDVTRMSEILEQLGATVEREDGSLRISSGTIAHTHLDEEASKRMRSSVVLTGPLLARYSSVAFPHPGGCVIGPRPIDLFLSAYEAMGASVREDDGSYEITSADKKLHGADIFFTSVSVTGTETIMLSAILAEGETIIRNAATEPEISHLAQFLNECGAKIRGAGTSTITIEGTGLLAARGKKYRVIPDRIELGSFLILGALAAKDLTLTDCDPDHTRAVTALLVRSGVPVEIGESEVRVRSNGGVKNFASFDVKTHEYPGFPTDLQAPMAVFLTQSSGEGLIFETIYENRLNYAQDLIHMGADIKVWDAHRATVKGPTPLKGREVDGPDLRAGLAFLIAAIIAEGESIINNAYFIDRGYTDIEGRLRSIGVDIERISK